MIYVLQDKIYGKINLTYSSFNKIKKNYDNGMNFMFTGWSGTRFIRYIIPMSVDSFGSSNL